MNLNSSIKQSSVSVLVPAAASVNIVVVARQNFFPSRLVVPCDVAGDFLVTDIKCQRNSQLYSIGALPALLFSDLAPFESLYFEGLEKNEEMTISVTNQSRIDRTFSCQVVGEKERRFESRRIVLGYGSTLVVGRGLANINVQPQRALFPDRLVIPSTIRRHFKVENVYYGKGESRSELDRSLLNQNFTELVMSNLGFKYPATARDHITVSVTNLSEQARNFQAAVVGNAVVHRRY